MAAQKSNYLIVYEKSAQVYSTANIETAIKTSIPKGCTEDDKHIGFLSYLPDEKKLCFYPLTKEQVEEAMSEIQTKLEKKESNE